ncbi:MAG TPA: PQQ-binding-like beta-propeller repeat protein [Acidimicrobiia bacterium]|nr:PQQ-binding-like beta-propeller repeat protein [Acidimicrobiia bacterium]
MQERTGPILLVIAFGAMLGFVAFLLVGPRDAGGSTDVGAGSTIGTDASGDTTPGSTGPEETQAGPGSTTTAPGQTDRAPGTVPGSTVGLPWGSVAGLTMFRGNPTRTWYGTGPISEQPERIWTYPENAMCSESTNKGVTTTWCGMGWTGQPGVWERPDGVTELIFGAYDRSVHFVDAETGQALRPEFPTGDIIKGSVTIDPDGFPLLYTGSRDDKLRIIALDRDEPTELWSLDAYAVEGIWNDDWDGNPLIIDDMMYEGGENGWFFAYQLNRAYDSEGKVTVDPELRFSMRGWTQDQLSALGDEEVSIENSIVAYEERVYFGNSGGRIVGLDVSDIRNGNAPVVFDYWSGGDIDPTLVVDPDGFVYASIEYEPAQMGSNETARQDEVGQLVKLDPYTDGDPRVWGVDLSVPGQESGTWATPALHEGVLYTNTHTGSTIAVDTESGEVVWEDSTAGWHSWSSPVVVDETLVVATCVGELRGYSLADPRSPQRSWTVPVGESCLEATPAIWNGVIYLGSRDGYLRAFR